MRRQRQSNHVYGSLLYSAGRYLERLLSRRMRSAAAALLATACTFPLPARLYAQPELGTGPMPKEWSPFTGLAQSPEANLFLGSATTSIPIQIPPGRKNLTPQLALAYTSGGGPGPYGYGWDLPLGRIERSSKRGVLSCATLQYADDFVLILPQATVEFIRDANGKGKARVEESFLRIEHTAATNTWQVWDKSGLKYTFGDTVATRLGRGSLTQILTDSCNANDTVEFTFSWVLTRIEEPNGNRIDITYTQDIAGKEKVLYPDLIRYGGHGISGHVFEVDLVWIYGRPQGDQIVNSMHGFRSELKQYLTEIVVRYLVTGATVRRYRLTYDFQAGDPADRRIGRQTFLTGVTLYDGNDQALARYDGLPASTTFFYHENRPENGRFGFGPAQSSYQLWLSQRDIGRSSDPGNGTSTLDVLDINGDGFLDWVMADPDCGFLPGRGLTIKLGGPEGFESLTANTVEWQTPFCVIRLGRRSGSSTDFHIYMNIDLIDLDGDSIPDFVDTRQWTQEAPYWRFFRGYVQANGAGGFQAPVNWPAPVKELRDTFVKDNMGVTNTGWGDAPGSVDQRDLIDMNNDGLLDLVVAPLNSLTWDVYINTGAGFEHTLNAQGVPQFKSHAFSTTIRALRWTQDQDEMLGFYDMNGDGLPDQVFTDFGHDPDSAVLRVYLNNGNFAVNQTSDHWVLPVPMRGTFKLRRIVNDDIYQQLLDINGDGLLDLVSGSGWSQANPYWKVALNRGSSFSTTALDWQSPFPYMRTAQGGGTQRDTLDMDGDGLPDHVDFAPATPGNVMWVYRNKGGAWCPSTNGVTCAAADGATNVAAKRTGRRSDLLVEMENGVGGQTVLEYRPSTQWDNSGLYGIPQLPFVVWTVTRIEHDDGMCLLAPGFCLNGSAHNVGNDITYAWGFYDRQNRQFRGFGLVDTKAIASGTEPRRGRLTAFHQSAALSGKVLAEFVYDASGGGTFTGKPLGRTVNTWECVHPASQSPVTCPAVPAANVWARLKRVEELTNSNFNYNSYQTLLTENHAWDQCGSKVYGNVAHSSKGDTAGFSRVHNHSDYFCKDDGAGYIVDKPRHVWTNDASDTIRLEEKWFFYDFQTNGVTQGNLTRVESWLSPWGGPSPLPCSANGAKECFKIDMDYDVFGNVLTVTDHFGRVTQTTYDGETNIYPSVVRSPTGLRKATGYDPACGALLWESISYTGTTIPAARRYRRYDSFCRLVRTALPDEDIDTAPHEQYFYELGVPATFISFSPARPSRVIVFLREPNGYLGVLPSYTLTDGLGRVIQQYSARMVEGQAALVGTSWEYASNGKVARQFAPFTITNPNPYAAPPLGTGFTNYDYDALGRVTAVLNPDGTFRQNDHSVAWRTTSTDECYTASNCTGSKTVEFRDALGRVAERHVYEEPNTFKARTAYSYDALGRLTSTIQGEAINILNPATYIAHTYDTLGRRTQVVDPDSGEWKYHYDAVGNLRVQDDPKSGQHIQFCYDSEDRMTRSCQVNGDFAGVLLSCTGSCPGERITYAYYTTAAAGQDRLGRLSAVTDTSGSSTFEQYDLRGRLLRDTKVVAPGGGFATTSATTRYAYDAADHLTSLTYPDGEVVHYFYDGAGQLRQVRSGTHQVDYLADLTYDRFGRPRIMTHGNGTADTRAYHDKTKNYRLASIDTKRGADKWLDLRYTAYSAQGLLTQLTDSGPKGAGNDMDNTATFSYDGLGRLTHLNMPRLGSPFNYAYDYLGNMTQKDLRLLSYSATRPHTLISTGAANITHDGNGNRETNGVHTYHYDYRDRLTAIDTPSHGVEFRYDYSGRRVARIVDGTTLTVYYSDLMEASGGWVTKYYYAGALRIATQRKQNAQFAALPQDAVRLAAVALERPVMVLFLRQDVQLGVAASVLLLAAGLALAPWKRKRVVGIAVRHGHVIGVAIAFTVSSLPWPVLVRPAEAQCPGPPPAGEIFHYHVDHLGSTQLITTSTGAVQEWIRYLAYGEIWGRYNSAGVRISPADERFRYEFTGYETDLHSGLQYAGARFYDPDLGMFLTHDPARQFPNPYAYGPWNPVNGTDPTGAFWIELLIATILAAVASAAVNTIIAAAQGLPLNQIGKAAAMGAVTGAVGVGLGVVAAGISVSLSAAAGTLPQNIGLQQALNALGEVAYRSAFSASIANAAGQATSAAGAPDWLSTLASIGAGYGWSIFYDQVLLDPSGDLARIEVKGDYRQVSNTQTHSNITTKAAAAAGYSNQEAETILQNNLAQDLDVWNNQSHFGFGAKKEFERFLTKAEGGSLRAAGAATHYIQDQHALGHIFPGTDVFAGKWLAPVRGFIHQTVGGEVNFFRVAPGGLRIPTSFDATTNFLLELRPKIAAGSAL